MDKIWAYIFSRAVDKKILTEIKKSRHVVTQGHKCAILNAAGWWVDFHSWNIFLIPRSYKASRIRRKVGNGSVLMGKDCLT